MGAASSIDLRPEEIDELTSVTKCERSHLMRRGSSRIAGVHADV